MDNKTSPSTSTSADLAPAKKRQVLSQWQLMKLRFLQHRIAVVALIVLALFYLAAIFAPLVAPYGPHIRHRSYQNAPPQIIRFWDEDGFSLRPFFFDQEQTLDMSTLTRMYTLDTSERKYLRFFVNGHPYKLLGFIPADIHLFGSEDGTPIFLFGTDNLGRDLFSRVMYGSQISLSIGLVGVFLSLVLGLILGGISGLLGGHVDNVIQRAIEILMSIPSIPLWMALSAALPPHWPQIRVYFGITVILSILGWTGVARVVRGKFLSLREEEFVLSARTFGASNFEIIYRHLIPSFMSYVIVNVTLSVPGMIMGETALSFLGLGMRAPAVSWGTLLQDAQNIRTVALQPWLMIPGLFVVFVVLAFNFVGDGLRDAADPYS